MEGPTPVSALIHAATMVAAGVFLVARVYPLFSLGAINGVTPSLTVVVWIGVITALMASLIALAQADIGEVAVGLQTIRRCMPIVLTVIQLDAA